MADKSKQIIKNNAEIRYPSPPSKKVINNIKKEIREAIKEEDIKKPNRLVPNPNGRHPIMFKKKYCYEIIDLFAKGKSNQVVAAELGISYMTFCNWRHKYKEFDIAVNRGQLLALRYWEEIARLNPEQGKLNHVLWMMNMTNKYKWITNRAHAKIQEKKIEKKILEIKIDDNRAARIINLAKRNETIIEARKTLADK